MKAYRELIEAAKKYLEATAAHAGYAIAALEFLTAITRAESELARLEKARVFEGIVGEDGFVRPEISICFGEGWGSGLLNKRVRITVEEIEDGK